MTPKDEKNVNIETLPLIVVGAGESQWMPDSWRSALWEYVQAWPSSGCGYGPFLAITEEERCDFIRKMAEDLVKSDNIGCRLIANNIGAFAAWEYEIPSDMSDNPSNDTPPPEPAKETPLKISVVFPEPRVIHESFGAKRPTFPENHYQCACCGYSSPISKYKHTVCWLGVLIWAKFIILVLGFLTLACWLGLLP